MRFFNFIYDNNYFKVLVICILLDTFFGILRAIREKKINSNIGIDGIIRKVGMMVAVMFFGMIDIILELNLIGFLPEEVRSSIGIEQVGISFVFNSLFIVFESLSILKNMIKCKLPIPKKLQIYLEKILKKFTTELKEGDEK